MIADVMDTDSVSDGAPSTSALSLLSNPLCKEMSLPALAAQCEGTRQLSPG